MCVGGGGGGGGCWVVVSFSQLRTRFGNETVLMRP